MVRGDFRRVSPVVRRHARLSVPWPEDFLPVFDYTRRNYAISFHSESIVTSTIPWGQTLFTASMTT